MSKHQVRWLNTVNLFLILSLRRGYFMWLSVWHKKKDLHFWAKGARLTLDAKYIFSKKLWQNLSDFWKCFLGVKHFVTGTHDISVKGTGDKGRIGSRGVWLLETLNQINIYIIQTYSSQMHTNPMIMDSISHKKSQPYSGPTGVSLSLSMRPSPFLFWPTVEKCQSLHPDQGFYSIFGQIFIVRIQPF